MERFAPPDAETRPVAILVVVGVGTLLAAMAGSMVNLALPDLGRDLGLSIEVSRWVVQSFLLATSVLMLPAGRLGDLLGHRQVYLGGFAVFGLASVACGLVDDIGWLIGLRVLQGLGGALTMANGPALLTTSFPDAMRGRALGIVASATYTGLTIGPPLGGAIVAALGWRWTFLLNLPVAVVILLLGLTVLPRRPRRPVAGFDLLGAALLMIGLPLVLLVLSRAQTWGAGAWQTWVYGLGGLSCLGVFVWWQRRAPAPLVDLGLFRSRVFAGAVISAVCNYMALFGVLLLAPFYLEEGLGMDPARTGVLLTATPLVMALVASPAGWASDRVGTRWLAFGGMAIMAGGIFGLSRLGPGVSAASVFAWLAVVGLGTGVFISPNSSALMGAAPRSQQGIAGSILAESRAVGMLLGVALSTSVFHAVGGETGVAWRAKDFAAFSWAELASVAVALCGGLAALLQRGGERIQGTNVR